MNTRQLQYVIVLSEERSFSEAANRLMISQPSLSQYIQKLENELETVLFERTVPLKLTDAGRIYVETARQIVRSEKEMTRKLEDIQADKRGSITIGTGFLNSVSLIPGVVRSFQQRYPDVEIIIYEDIELNLRQKAELGELDFIFSTSGMNTTIYNNVYLFQEEFLLAIPGAEQKCGEGLPIEKIPYMDVAQMENVPFVMLNTGTYISDIVKMIYREQQIKPRVAVTCTSAMTAYGMAKAGVGATLIPYGTYRADYSSGMGYFRIAGCRHYREVHIYYDKNLHMTEIMKEFVQECVRYYKGFHNGEDGV